MTEALDPISDLDDGAVAVAEAPYQDDDPVEILDLLWLETAEEAASDATEPADRSFGVPRTTSRRSAGSQGRKKVKVSAGKARMAKFIIYGGVLLLGLVTLVVTSWKLPQILYSMEVIDQKYIWPWTLVFDENEEQAEEVVSEQTYATASGRVLSAAEYRETIDGIDAVLSEVHRSLDKAEKTYKEALQVDDQDLRRQKKVEAYEAVKTDYDRIGNLQQQLEELQGLVGVNARTREAKDLFERLAPKRNMWGKDADISNDGW